MDVMKTEHLPLIIHLRKKAFRSLTSSMMHAILFIVPLNWMRKLPHFLVCVIFMNRYLSLSNASFAFIGMIT